MISEFNKICECLENVDMEKYNTYRLVNHAKIMVFNMNLILYVKKNAQIKLIFYLVKKKIMIMIRRNVLFQN